MSFLKDFKEDLSQAVAELLPENIEDTEKAEKKEVDPVFANLAASEEALMESLEKTEEEKENMDDMVEGVIAETEEENAETIAEEVVETPVEEPAKEPEKEETVKDTKKSSEVATITAGTRIHGDIESDGSLEILGTITGNVLCSGKLTITGTIIGNSDADEIYADSAKVEGEINSSGAVKIGLGSVILGDVKATSAVIAGAVRGDIDVHGPVIVDSTAVVMGNIKSRSVQINNGAVIEGFCSQCYSDVSVANFFEDNKPSETSKKK